MSPPIPAWLRALQPLRTPRLERLSGHSEQMVWHVDMELTAWTVPPERLLSGSETWNGKALVASSSPHLETAVGEVEVTERLRKGLPNALAYWVAGDGRPPEQWHHWSLTPQRRMRLPWLLELDQALRDAEPLLADHDRGWPDVLAWCSGVASLLCVGYRGPRPSEPAAVEEISREQDAWLRAALRLGRLSLDRCAVARWVPSVRARTGLSRQLEARKGHCV